MRKLLLFILIMLLLNSLVQQAKAQYAESISSDRPGMTFSANTVGSRVVQFQVGGDFLGQNTSLGSSRTDEFLGGAFDGSIRVGIIDRLEIAFPVYYRQVTLQNVTLGKNEPFKYLSWGINLRGNVLKSNGRTPDIGLMVEVRFPDAETERFADGIYQLFLLNISQPLEERITLSSSIGMVRQNFADLIYTLNLTVKVSPRTSLFVEHYGAYRREYGTNTFLNREPTKFDLWYGKVNGGVAITPINDVQIDVQAGYGGNLVAPYSSSDWYVGMGLSWRLRFKKKESNKDKS